MTWWAIEVHAAPTLSEQLGTFIAQTTGQAVEERSDGTVMGYTDTEAAARHAGGLVGERFGPGVTWTVSPVGSVDWSTRWRDGLTARRIGRLLVTPSWLGHEPGPDTVVVDPEMAFGTGEHGSTRGALALLDRWLRPGDRVLDLGSGSGILTIAAAKLGAGTALGIEIDDEALPVAERNAVVNRVDPTVKFVVGDAALLAPLAAPVELVVSNILRTVNLQLLAPIRQALTSGGLAIFAGMETPEAELFRPVLEERGWTVVDEVVDESWWSVAARTA